MIYVYAVVDDPGVEVAGMSGLGDAPLITVRQRHLGAVCSLTREQPIADPAGMWRHHQVLQTLMERCTVAPVRFGTVLADFGRLRDLMASEGPLLAPLLARLEGKVELAVRGRDDCAAARRAGTGADDGDRMPAPGSSGPEGGSGSGRAYLRSLLSARRQSALSERLEAVHQELAGHAHESRLRAGDDGSMVGAYLVDSGGVATFREAVVNAEKRHGHLSLSVTGPWAPSSFIGEGAGDA